MIRAAIDLGTNTCLLLVADWDTEKNEATRILWDQISFVRLGEGVDQTHVLSPEAIDRTLACLKKYLEKINSFGLQPQEVLCVATSQARDAYNGKIFLSELESKLGFCFQILSGLEEARLTFQGGLLPGCDPRLMAVIDIGGGSTEITTLESGKSLDMGSVRFTERYLKSNPVTDEEFWECQAAIDQALLELESWRKNQDLELLGVAGTATNLAQWHLNLPQFEPDKINTCVLTRGDVHRMVEELKWRTIKERLTLPGLTPGRADVLLAGALILWRTMEILDFPDCRVSTRGLRFGILKNSLFVS